jgi:hypothetical protein
VKRSTVIVMGVALLVVFATPAGAATSAWTNARLTTAAKSVQGQVVRLGQRVGVVEEANAKQNVLIAAAQATAEQSLQRAMTPGPQGEPGLPGAIGAVGPAGANGLDGLSGRDGDSVMVTGPSSADECISGGYVLNSAFPICNGLDGADGADGNDGAPGVAGVPGERGLVGAPGQNGVDGAAGTDGRDGADGVAGTDGRDGADGANGASAYEVWLATGNTGAVSDFISALKGERGEKGEKGDIGPPGAPGTPGTPGNNGFRTCAAGLGQLSLLGAGGPNAALAVTRAEMNVVINKVNAILACAVNNP